MVDYGNIDSSPITDSASNARRSHTISAVAPQSSIWKVEAVIGSEAESCMAISSRVLQRQRLF